jgi:hypothetical protein
VRRSEITLSHFTLVRRKCSENLLLFPLRDLEKVKGPSKFRRDCIELVGGDLKVAMGLF